MSRRDPAGGVPGPPVAEDAPGELAPFQYVSVEVGDAIIADVLEAIASLEAELDEVRAESAALLQRLEDEWSSPDRSDAPYERLIELADEVRQDAASEAARILERTKAHAQGSFGSNPRATASRSSSLTPPAILAADPDPVPRSNNPAGVRPALTRPGGVGRH